MCVGGFGAGRCDVVGSNLIVPFGCSLPLYEEGRGLISSSAAPANKDEDEEEVNKEHAGVELDSELRKSPVVASIESGPGTAFEFEHIFNDECASATSTCGARKKGRADNGPDDCRERGDKEVESVECADDDDGDDDDDEDEGNVDSSERQFGGKRPSYVVSCRHSSPSDPREGPTRLWSPRVRPGRLSMADAW
jgi:hypothetical protein